ncbi:hypothetical protein AMTRI_Chr06g174710 [Amborella trichopoda]
MADKEREAMPKPRGFNSCCITTIASIASIATIASGRSAKKERGRFVKRERKGERFEKRERGRSVKRENRRERLTLITC